MPAGRDTQAGASGPPGAAGPPDGGPRHLGRGRRPGPRLLRTALLTWACWRGKL